MKAFAVDDLDVDTWIEQSIAENGFAQISLHDPSSGRPGFAFTVGLLAFRKVPELFCMGVAPDIAGRLFSLCVEGHDAARVDLAAGNQDIAELVPGYVLRARRTSPELALLANQIRPDSAPEITTMVQILLPDNHGKFPGDPDCDPDIAASQDPDWLMSQTTN